MNKRNLKSVPQHLWGKTYLITGEYPGTGKSYFKRHLVDILRKHNYKVWTLGTTHKSSDENTYQKQLKNKEKIYSQRSRFIIIDECSMLDKKRFEQMKKQNPHCMFILVGDDLQFNPPGKYMSSITPEPVDKLYKFNVIYRSDSDTLKKFIQSIKDGQPDINFIKKHESKNRGDSLVVVYKNETKNYINDKCYRNDYLLSHKSIIINGITYTTKLKVNNNEIWKIIRNDNGIYKLESQTIDRNEYLYISTLDYRFFEKSDSVNIHKIQGDTLKCNVHYLYDSHVDWLRTLYVTSSRVKNEQQLTFFDGYSDFVSHRLTETKGVELKSRFNPDWTGNNEDLIKIVETELDVLDSLDNVTLQGNVDTLYNISTFYKKVTPIEFFLFGLGTPNKNITNNIDSTLVTVNFNLTSSTSNEKLKLKRCRDKIDKELLELTSFDYTSNGTTEINDNGQFVCKNLLINPKDGHSNKNLSSMKNFVFEFDDLSIEEQLKLYEKNKKMIYRVIHSGNKSLHFWIRVENCPNDVEIYHQISDYLNETLFDKKSCKSYKSPSQLMRKPNGVRDNGNIQKVIYNKRNIIEVDYLHLNNEKEVEPVKQSDNSSNSSFDNSVEYYFNMIKNDHNGKNGGRGELILSKTFKQKYKYDWTNSQCKELIRLLCNEWNCKEKISRLQTHFKEN
jgi:hypothetical protein